MYDWKQDFDAWWKTNRPTFRKVISPTGFARSVWKEAHKVTKSRVTITSDENGHVVAVSLCDAEGQLTDVLWERKAGTGF